MFITVGNSAFQAETFRLANLAQILIIFLAYKLIRNVQRKIYILQKYMFSFKTIEWNQPVFFIMYTDHMIIKVQELHLILLKL